MRGNQCGLQLAVSMGIFPPWREKEAKRQGNQPGSTKMGQIVGAGQG